MAEVTREARHVLELRALGQGGQVADRHVFEHALPKRGHGGLLCERAWLSPSGSPRSVWEEAWIESANRLETPDAQGGDQRVGRPPTAKRFSPTGLMSLMRLSSPLRHGAIRRRLASCQGTCYGPPGSIRESGMRGGSSLRKELVGKRAGESDPLRSVPVLWPSWLSRRHAGSPSTPGRPLHGAPS